MKAAPTKRVVCVITVADFFLAQSNRRRRKKEKKQKKRRCRLPSFFSERRSDVIQRRIMMINKDDRRGNSYLALSYTSLLRLDDNNVIINEMAVELILAKSTFYYQWFDLLIYCHPIQAAAMAASDTNMNRQNRSIEGRISGRYFLSPLPS